MPVCGLWTRGNHKELNIIKCYGFQYMLNFHMNFCVLKSGDIAEKRIQSAQCSSNADDKPSQIKAES